MPVEMVIGLGEKEGLLVTRDTTGERPRAVALPLRDFLFLTIGGIDGCNPSNRVFPRPCKPMCYLMKPGDQGNPFLGVCRQNDPFWLKRDVRADFWLDPEIPE